LCSFCHYCGSRSDKFAKMWKIKSNMSKSPFIPASLTSIINIIFCFCFNKHLNIKTVRAINFFDNKIIKYSFIHFLDLLRYSFIFISLFFLSLDSKDIVSEGIQNVNLSQSHIPQILQCGMPSFISNFISLSTQRTHSRSKKLSSKFLLIVFS